MGAQHPRHRKNGQTAREVAIRYGISERTVRNLIAEPRAAFEARAAARQDEALALHEAGLSYREVGERLGVSRHTASGLCRRARERRNVERSSAAA